MVGTGEYTTGYVHDQASTSDKGAGVVAITLFDLRRRGHIGHLHLAGTTGRKFPGIRAHLEKMIGQRYANLSTQCRTYPEDSVGSNPLAYRLALEALEPGDAVIVSTPDDTHFDIALDAVERGLHVLVAKPIVKTLAQHLALKQAADDHDVVVAMEVHKRWDPIYRDARDQIRKLGAFNYFSSYMSQPKSQLETFRRWAGKSSDISYYLNAHHIDFNVWAVGDSFRPKWVSATSAQGVARSRGIPTEDTISLHVVWANGDRTQQAIADYTASWIAPRGEVHSQQRFHYLATEGEIRVDQAHRGYHFTTDAQGYHSPNPLFMKYEPDEKGEFAGQSGYGYQSISAFIEAVLAIREGRATVGDANQTLAGIRDTLPVTAILEAGRISLDQDRRQVEILSDSNGDPAQLR